MERQSHRTQHRLFQNQSVQLMKERKPITGKWIHTVNGGIETLLLEKVVEALDILILASVGGTQDSADTDGVLIDEFDTLLGVEDIAVLGAVHEPLLNVEVASSLLPANLYSSVHDNVGLVVRLATSLTLILPALLHREHTQHDSLGGTNGAGAHSVAVLIVDGDVEEASDHGDAAVLRLCVRETHLFSYGSMCLFLPEYQQRPITPIG